MNPLWRLLPGFLTALLGVVFLLAAASALAETRDLTSEGPAPAENGAAQTGLEITSKDGVPMVLVPEGEFLYGEHNLRLSLPAFYMDRYEVTTSRYATFLQATGREEPEYWGEVRLTTEGELPVVGVTWNDADAYCRWAGKRLPTEQEWEKAARGTDGRTYPWGNEEPNDRLANYGRICFFCDVYADKLKPVDSYEAGKSPYGIYNMAGNVWEWVEEGVLHGGSWRDGANYLRSWDQYRDLPMTRDFLSGFRCAKTP